MVKQKNSITKNHRSTKSELRNVYQQIITAYDREVKQKKYFADEALFRANRTLPKLDADHSNQEKVQKKEKKLLISASVFAAERKQILLDYCFTESKESKEGYKFDKINIPNILTQRDRQILSERNRKLLEFYKKFEPKSGNIESPIKISFIRKIKHNEAQTSFLEKRNQTEDNKSNIISEASAELMPNQKRMISILKQVKQKRNKMQFPNMKSKISSSVKMEKNKKKQNSSSLSKYSLMSTKQVDICQINKIQPQIQTPRIKIKNKPLLKIKSDEKISTFMIKRKKFNWKNQEMNILPINKEEYYALIRGYFGINSIQELNSGFYRAYIGFGNNHHIVKKTLKERGHWTIVESLNDDPHFVWTQFKLINFHDFLKSQQSQRSFCIGENSQVSIQQLQNDEQLQQFIKLKSNDFLLGSEKLMERKLFLKLMHFLKQRFINKGNIQQFRRLKFYALEHLPEIRSKFSKQTAKAQQIKLHNHIDGAGAIGDKKGLFHYLKKYCQLYDEKVTNLVPPTFHLDSEDFNHSRIFQQIPEGPWILKPGQQTNRGQGITIHITRQSLLSQLAKKKVHSRNPNVKYTNIIQKYIFPLLYFGRKFDIRIWILWSGSAKQAWWYQQGYLRTSSKQFTLKNTNKFIHLTNDAIQSMSDDYGKFEPSNKLSFNEFNKYLQNQYGYKGFYDIILKQMKQMAIKVFKMGNLMFNKLQKQHTFELFGFDYLIDNRFKPWLIECNTNPCLEINCSLLTRLIPNMLDNLMSLVIDPLFPIPTKRKLKEPQIWHQQTFKFELLYDGNQDMETKQKILTHPDFKIVYSGEYQQVQGL